MKKQEKVKKDIFTFKIPGYSQERHLAIFRKAVESKKYHKETLECMARGHALLTKMLDN